MNKIVTIEGYEILDFNGPEDLAKLLRGIFPDGDGWVEVGVFFKRMGISKPVDVNMVRGKMGLSDNMYKIEDLADLMWDLSNIEALERNE